MNISGTYNAVQQSLNSTAINTIATEQTESEQRVSLSVDGDVVTISDEARAAANALTSTDPPPPGGPTNPVPPEAPPN